MVSWENSWRDLEWMLGRRGVEKWWHWNSHPKDEQPWLEGGLGTRGSFSPTLGERLQGQGSGAELCAVSCT